MFYNFCTLFDKNYLYKGLALYDSLKRNCKDFKLFILCMDDIVYNILSKMELEKIELISLKEFEDEKLLKIKNTRSWAEYCWTCTASLLLFLLKKYRDLETMTYLDSDLYFFSDPLPIFQEFNGDNIFITKHNYSPEFERLATYGIYNVQFMIFRNNKEALESLEWWREKTIENCSAKGTGKNMKGGDQIYLNDWPERFKKVHTLQNVKLSLAPWNINKYNLILKDTSIFVEDTKLIFYHFHSFEINGLNKFTLADGAYKITESARKLIYDPYIEKIKSVMQRVIQFYPSFKYGIRKRNIREKIKFFIKKIFYEIYRLTKLI